MLNVPNVYFVEMLPKIKYFYPSTDSSWSLTEINIIVYQVFDLICCGMSACQTTGRHYNATNRSPERMQAKDTVVMMDRKAMTNDVNRTGLKQITQIVCILLIYTYKI